MRQNVVVTQAFIWYDADVSQTSGSSSLDVLHERSAYLFHHRAVPEPTRLHQVQAELIMATARDDGSRDVAGAMLPDCIAEAR